MTLTAKQARGKRVFMDKNGMSEGTEVWKDVKHGGSVEAQNAVAGEEEIGKDSCWI